MSAADGSVGGVLRIVNHGPDSSRWNLVIVGDGYQASELAQYHTDAQAFVDVFRVTPPFDELWCGINVHRIEVTSTDSGADDPTGCGGTGATPRTYFDSTFCSPWGGTTLDRLLTVDAASAKSVALSKVPQTHQVLCIVNSSKYGGSGGINAAVCSTHASASKIAIHEIGHSAFGLADEYENGGTAGGTEPGEPNVTLDANRATNKWRDLIAASTPMPSSCYGDCPGCVPPATPPPAGAVGAYEGAQYVHCGMYRPLPACYMRDYSPFCPVCARVIRQILQPLLPPETISLGTPSISFADVPAGMGGIGVTTHRAVVCDVASCRELTFRITSGPTGGFGTPFGTTTALAPGSGYGPTVQARLWLSYTSTSPGATSTGSVTVRCDETGQAWIIPITANTVARPRAAVVLVMDRSGSMSEDAGDGTTKVGKLRESARVFVDAMLPGDGIGLVRFDDTAQRLMDVEDVGPLSSGAGRAAAIGHIEGSGLDPAGATSIGGGVQEGKLALDAAVAPVPYSVKAMVVLTDGIENRPPMLSAVGSSITANTFAIGLGLPYNISVAALNTLTQGHSGYLLVTGTLTPDQRTRLTKYFLQILAGITNASVVLDPAGQLGYGVEQRIPFMLSDADFGFDAFLLTPVPWAVDYELETPDGRVIDSGVVSSLPTAALVVGDAAAFYRVALPALPDDPAGSHAGAWQLVLRLGKHKAWDRASYASFTEETRGTLPFDVLVHAYSNLVFRATCVQSSYEPGSDVVLYATLREYDVDVGSRATAWAEVTRPDGGATTVILGETNGQYIGRFKTSVPGLYTVRVRAQGETYSGSPFTREQVLTATAIPGGGQHPLPDGDDPLVELLCCMLQGKGLTPDFWERLERSGIDPRTLRRCLTRLCRERWAE
jgi:hypothetical protein